MLRLAPIAICAFAIVVSVGCVNPAGMRLYEFRMGGSIVITECDDAAPPRVVTLPGRERATIRAGSANSRGLLATVWDDEWLQLSDSSGNAIRDVRVGDILALAWSPTGDRLAALRRMDADGGFTDKLAILDLNLNRVGSYPADGPTTRGMRFGLSWAADEGAIAVSSDTYLERGAAEWCRIISLTGGSAMELPFSNVHFIGSDDVVASADGSTYRLKLRDDRHEVVQKVFGKQAQSSDPRTGFFIVRSIRYYALLDVWEPVVMHNTEGLFGCRVSAKPYTNSVLCVVSRADSSQAEGG